MSKAISRRVIHTYMSTLIDCTRRGMPHIDADSPELSKLAARKDFDIVIEHLENIGLVSLFHASDLAPVITVTHSGMSYLERRRDQASERRWTRGLAIAALVISIGSLAVSVIALMKR